MPVRLPRRKQNPATLDVFANSTANSHADIKGYFPRSPVTVRAVRHQSESGTKEQYV